MTDKYNWNQIIGNITEMEFEALKESMEELAYKNKWKFLSQDDLYDLENQVDNLTRDLESAEDFSDEVEDRIQEFKNINKEAIAIVKELQDKLTKYAN